MSESFEVALAMVEALTAKELNKIRFCQGITPLDYVKQQMQGESHGVIDAVHFEFSKLIQLP